ncbi:MAG: CoA-transferase, partial [Nitrospinota bacterium]|nr:CoA-transferase [Nitrospinota bacterium]
VFPELYRANKIELELVPQGTLAERMRAGAAGIPAFYTATAVGTLLAQGKECREFDGREYLMERGLKAAALQLYATQSDLFVKQRR